MENSQNLELSSDIASAFKATRRKSDSCLLPHVSERIISEKLIFYCSDFDLNINEWYSEWENIHIFRKRVAKNLGKPSAFPLGLQY